LGKKQHKNESQVCNGCETWSIHIVTLIKSCLKVARKRKIFLRRNFALSVVVSQASITVYGYENARFKLMGCDLVILKQCSIYGGIEMPRATFNFCQSNKTSVRNIETSKPTVKKI